MKRKLYHLLHLCNLKEVSFGKLSRNQRQISEIKQAINFGKL